MIECGHRLTHIAHMRVREHGIEHPTLLAVMIAWILGKVKPAGTRAVVGLDSPMVPRRPSPKISLFPLQEGQKIEISPVADMVRIWYARYKRVAFFENVLILKKTL